MARKRSTKTGHRKKWYLSIVSHVLEHGKLPDYNIPKTTFQHYINQLKSDGIISKIGYGVWTADRDKFEQLEFKKEVRKQGSSTRDIRGHGFQWVIAIPDIPNWHKRRKFLDSREIMYQESKANWAGQKVLIRGYKCWLMDNVISIFNPKDKSFYAYCAKDSLQMAVIDLVETLKGLENLLGIDLKIEQKWNIKPSKQHYAKIRDALAEDYNKKNLKLSVKFEGDEWLIVDNSLGRAELEFTHSRTAVRDADRAVVPFFNDLRSHFEATGESIKISDMLQIINAQQQQINSMLYKPPERLSEKDSYFG